MGVSKNNSTPKSSILIGCSIINHPFWGTPIFGNTQIIQLKPAFIDVETISFHVVVKNQLFSPLKISSKCGKDSFLNMGGIPHYIDRVSAECIWKETLDKETRLYQEALRH